MVYNIKLGFVIEFILFQNCPCFFGSPFINTNIGNTIMLKSNVSRFRVTTKIPIVLHLATTVCTTINSEYVYLCVTEPADHCQCKLDL